MYFKQLFSNFDTYWYLTADDKMEKGKLEHILIELHRHVIFIFESTDEH